MFALLRYSIAFLFLGRIPLNNYYARMDYKRISTDFFLRDVLDVAPDILGKTMVRNFGNGLCKSYIINEVEAYRGQEDLACHASKGRTKRTEIMYANGGFVYVYLIYGMHWMLNFVTGNIDNPQAILIRGIDSFIGPGRVSRELKIDATFYGENLNTSDRIWIAETNLRIDYSTGPRIGVDYAGENWASKPWRFWIK